MILRDQGLAVVEQEGEQRIIMLPTGAVVFAVSDKGALALIRQWARADVEANGAGTLRVEWREGTTPPEAK